MAEMLVATTIPPAEDLHFTCNLCSLSYSADDYMILLQNKKLAYFTLEESGVPQFAKEDIPSDCLCHECLYKVLHREANGKELKVKLDYFGKESYGLVDPSDERGYF